jgi:hypothetical protein
LVILILAIVSKNTSFSDNLNIYWTIPSLFVAIFRKRPLCEILKTAYLVVLTIMLLMWNHLPQTFSLTFIPWIVVLIAILLLDLQWFYRMVHAHRPWNRPNINPPRSF